MTDLPDYLTATGLGWQISLFDAWNKTARVGDYTLLLRGAPRHERLMVQVFGRAPAEEIPTEGADLSTVIARVLAEHHVFLLCKSARANADAPVIPPLPAPLLTAFNAALRAQLPAALAEQSRVTEALVSLGLSLGMTSADLAPGDMEMT